MKTEYFNLRRISLFSLVGFLGWAATSCSSYQNTSSTDSDGVYGSVPRDGNNQPAYRYNDRDVNQNNDQSTGYANYFNSLQEEYPVFTDVDGYSTYNDTVARMQNQSVDAYGGWGESTNNVTVNVYGGNNWGYGGWGGYGLGYGWGGYPYYGGWGYGGYGGWGLGYGGFYGGGWGLGLGWGYGGLGYGYGGWGNGYGWGNYYGGGGYYGGNNHYYNNTPRRSSVAYPVNNGRVSGRNANGRSSIANYAGGRSATGRSAYAGGRSTVNSTRFNSGRNSSGVVRSAGSTRYNNAGRTTGVSPSRNSFNNSSRSYNNGGTRSYSPASTPSRSSSPTFSSPSRSSGGGGGFGGGRSSGGGGGGSRGGGGGGGRRG
jgi:hypothetical protein